MPRRMGEYFAGILEQLEHLAKENRAEFCSFVVYLDPQTYVEDPGYMLLRGRGRSAFFIGYEVVKVWELSPETVLAMESPGLCPFVPLMRGKPGELLLQSFEKIQRTPESVASAETKRDLLAIASGLASRVIKDRALLRRLVANMSLQGESYVFDWFVEEGEARGLEKGQVKGARRALDRVVQSRFGNVPADIRSRIDGIADLVRLEDLIDLAVRAPDLETIRTALGAA